MISRIALALTVAAISTGAAAQQSKTPILPMKVIEIAPSGTSAAAQVRPPSNDDRYDFAKISNTPPETIPTGLLDACIIEATGRLPKVDGLRVTNSSYEFDYSQGRYDQYWRVSISVKLGDRQARYSWDCRIDTRGRARLK